MGDAALTSTPEPNIFKVGEVYERGAWIPTEYHAPGAARQIAKHFREVSRKHRVEFSKLNVEILSGDHERSPKPQAMPFFVTVWAAVEKIEDVETIDVAWVDGLRPGDLYRMREATKAALAANKQPITDYAIDLAIGVLGPKVARRMLEEKIHGQTVDGVFLKAANDRRPGD